MTAQSTVSFYSQFCKWKLMHLQSVVKVDFTLIGHFMTYTFYFAFCKYLICHQRFTAFRQPAEVKTEYLNGEEKSFFAIVVAARRTGQSISETVNVLRFSLGFPPFGKREKQPVRGSWDIRSQRRMPNCFNLIREQEYPNNHLSEPS